VFIKLNKKISVLSCIQSRLSNMDLRCHFIMAEFFIFHFILDFQ
jgi:hypothetical protein